jgi:ammonium transporter, Amt family
MSSTILILAWLGMLMRVGQALHTVGSVRARSAATITGRALLGVAVSVLACWIGATIDRLVFDDPNTLQIETLFPFARDAATLVTILPMMMLPMAVLSGAVAERARIRGPLVAGTVLTLFLIPGGLIVAGWVFGEGFARSPVPVLCIHLASGAAAVVAARFVGPRNGKYNRDGSANFIPGHSLPLVFVGDFLMLLGIPMATLAWMGGESPVAIGTVLLASTVGASAAALMGLVVCHLRSQRLDVLLTWAASVAGAIVGSACSTDWAAVLGAVAGGIVPLASIKLDLKFRIDDPANFAVMHVVGAVVAAVAVGLSGPIHSPAVSVDVIGSTFVSLIICAGFSVVGIVPVLVVMRRLGGLRVSEGEEFEGLDLTNHDINAYPDFQQTMIKSYHLRQ